MKDVKQKYTNIKFKELPNTFPEIERKFYQARIRYLTLFDYWFMEVENDGSHYIMTTVGTWCLDGETKKFVRVMDTTGVVPTHKLTYYTGEKPKPKKKHVGYTKPKGEPNVRMTHEMRRKIIEDSGTCVELAKKYKCNPTTIWTIKNRAKQRKEQSDE